MPPSQSRQDFIPDRPSIGGSRIDTAFVIQEIDEIAGPSERRVDLGYVENDEIHRNATEKGNPPAAEAARPT